MFGIGGPRAQAQRDFRKGGGLIRGTTREWSYTEGTGGNKRWHLTADETGGGVAGLNDEDHWWLENEAERVRARSGDHNTAWHETRVSV